jgi:diadenylate cyclase
MGFIKFRLIDGVDILIVAIIIYYFLSFIKGTKAIQMMIGLLGVLVLGILAEFFKLDTISFIAKGFGAAWLIVFVILFQPELRNAFARIGKTKIGRLFTAESKDIINELVKSVVKLSELKYGGIIAVERNISCKAYIDAGYKIEGKLSTGIVSAIFNPGSPLHDGAIIVKGDTILASSCILPLSDRKLSPYIGTRHRAALGLAEETDAVCIIVSEETGNISLAINHELIMNISAEELESKLIKEVG